MIEWLRSSKLSDLTPHKHRLGRDTIIGIKAKAYGQNECTVLMQLLVNLFAVAMISFVLSYSSRTASSDCRHRINNHSRSVDIFCVLMSAGTASTHYASPWNRTYVTQPIQFIRPRQFTNSASNIPDNDKDNTRTSGVNNTCSDAVDGSVTKVRTKSKASDHIDIATMTRAEMLSYIRGRVHITHILRQLLPGHAVSTVGTGSDIVCICPFHEDTRPSMRVSDGRRCYHCFACGAHGDAVQFALRTSIPSLSFDQALQRVIALSQTPVEKLPPLTHKRFVSSQQLIHSPPPLPHPGPTVTSPAASNLAAEANNLAVPVNEERLREVLKLSAAHFEACLQLHLQQDCIGNTFTNSDRISVAETMLDSTLGSALARIHLRDRGVSPSTCAAFGIGYAPSPTHSRIGSQYLVAVPKSAVSQGASLSDSGSSSVNDVVMTRASDISGRAIQIPQHTSLTAMLIAQGFTQAELVAAGVTIPQATHTHKAPSYKPMGYDRFRHRLMVPIRDGQGRVIAFGGRVLPTPTPPAHSQKIGKLNPQSLYQPAKYINSPSSAVFSKGNCLFGIDKLRRANSGNYRNKRNSLLVDPQTNTTATTVIVEGYFDVISLHEHGVHNAVASMGTAVSAQQLLLAAEGTEVGFWTDRESETDMGSGQCFADVVLLLDADAAGERAVQRVCDQVLAPAHAHMSFNATMTASNEASSSFRWVDSSEAKDSSIKKESVVERLRRVSVRVASIRQLLEPSIASRLSLELDVPVETVYGWGLCKDTSDLCEAVATSLPPPAEMTGPTVHMRTVMNVLEQNSLDWKAWFFDWIVRERGGQVTSVASTGGVSSKEANVSTDTCSDTNLSAFVLEPSSKLQLRLACALRNDLAALDSALVEMGAFIARLCKVGSSGKIFDEKIMDADGDTGTLALIGLGAKSLGLGDDNSIVEALRSRLENSTMSASLSTPRSTYLPLRNSSESTKPTTQPLHLLHSNNHAPAPLNTPIPVLDDAVTASRRVWRSSKVKVAQTYAVGGGTEAGATINNITKANTSLLS